MGQNMGLPGGANDWAREVNKALETLGQLQEMARRICNDFGLDIANPRRGLYTGDTPSVDNPVQLKLPSLQDLDIRDAQDGDLLTFDGKRGVWVARRHDTVQLPKEFPQGDPDSYYVPEPEEEEPPADGEWFAPLIATNLMLDPDLTNGMQENWKLPPTIVGTDVWHNVAKSLEWVPSGGMDGGACLRMVMGDGYNHAPPVGQGENWVVFDDIPLDTYFAGVHVKMESTDYNGSAYAYYEALDADGNVLRSDYCGSGGLNSTTWVLLRYNPTLTPAGAVSRRLKIRYEGNYPGMNNKVMLIDRMFLSNDTQDYFDGNTPDTAELAYSWTGAPNNSHSEQRSARELQMPTTITLGQEFTVKGRYFTPGANIAVRDDWWINNVQVTADASGNFEATLLVPENTDPDNGPVAGYTGPINIDSGWGTVGLYIPVTYQ